MLILLSPAKTLDFDKQRLTRRNSTPQLLDDSLELVALLRKLSPGQLSKLMGISPDLARKTHEEFANWSHPFSTKNAKQALLAFRGNAYVGLNADEYSAEDFARAQQSLRILSGLHGVLRPLDLIQPYRLEMGTKLKSQRGKNLYEFWGDRITELINKDLRRESEPVVLNLASGEYFKAIKKRELSARVVTPAFKEKRNGSYKSIGTFAKMARGMMASYVIKHGSDDIADVKSFNSEGYRFAANLSKDDEWTFIRDSV